MKSIYKNLNDVALLKLSMDKAGIPYESRALVLWAPDWIESGYQGLPYIFGFRIIWAEPGPAVAYSCVN